MGHQLQSALSSITLTPDLVGSFYSVVSVTFHWHPLRKLGLQVPKRSPTRKCSMCDRRRILEPRSAHVSRNSRLLLQAATEKQHDNSMNPPTPLVGVTRLRVSLSRYPLLSTGCQCFHGESCALPGMLPEVLRKCLQDGAQMSPWRVQDLEMLVAGRRIQDKLRA